MKRVEIISNQAIAEDILDALEAHGLGDHYTLVNHVYGRGKKGSRLGSSLWPEENCYYLLYLEDDQAVQVKSIIAVVKEKFPNEGTKCFLSSVE